MQKTSQRTCMWGLEPRTYHKIGEGSPGESDRASAGIRADWAQKVLGKWEGTLQQVMLAENECWHLVKNNF